jgi:hypothetical protein
MVAGAIALGLTARADEVPAESTTEPVAAPAPEPAPTEAPPVTVTPAPEPAPVEASSEKKVDEAAPPPAPEAPTAAAPAAKEEASETTEQKSAKKGVARRAGGFGLNAGAVDDHADVPLRFGGVMLDLTVMDSTSLNLANYSNQAIVYISPIWPMGRIFLKETPFSRLTLSGRWVLTRNFAGYEPNTVTPSGDLGYSPRCSNIAQGTNGVLDPNSVQRCVTNADYRITPGDVWLTVANPALYKIPAVDVVVTPSLRLILPASYESFFATLRFGTTATVNLSRGFFADQLTLSAAFGFTKYFHASTTPATDGLAPEEVDGPVTAGYRASQIGSNSANFYVDPSRAGSGSMNPSFAHSQMLSLDYAPASQPKLSFNLIYYWLHLFSYEATQCLVEVAGQSYDVCAAADRVAKVSNGVGTAGRAVSDLQMFYLAGNYQATPWLGFTLSWTTFAPQRMPDNSFRQGFISTDYNAFTSVALGATFSLNRPDEGSTDQNP